MVDAQCPCTTSGLEPLDDALRIVGPLRLVRNQLQLVLSDTSAPNVVSERQHPVVPDIARLLDELLLRPRIVQQHIGYRAALLLGCLRLDPRPRVGLVHPPLDDPRHSSFY